MYAKLINGVLLGAPKAISEHGLTYYNPSAEMLAEHGYMEVVDTPYPEVEEGDETVYAASYEVQDGRIVKVWTEYVPVEVSPEPTPVDTVGERLDALESAVTELAEVIANG